MDKVESELGKIYRRKEVGLFERVDEATSYLVGLESETSSRLVRDYMWFGDADGREFGVLVSGDLGNYLLEEDLNRIALEKTHLARYAIVSLAKLNPSSKNYGFILSLHGREDLGDCPLIALASMDLDKTLKYLDKRVGENNGAVLVPIMATLFEREEESRVDNLENIFGQRVENFAGLRKAARDIVQN